MLYRAGWSSCSLLMLHKHRYSCLKLIQFLSARKIGDSKDKFLEMLNTSCSYTLQTFICRSESPAFYREHSRSPLFPYKQSALTIMWPQLIFQLEDSLKRPLWDIKGKKGPYKHIRNKNNKIQPGLLFKGQQLTENMSNVISFCIKESYYSLQ